MIILRKAELADFEIYKQLYEDMDYQWLYYDKTKQDISEEEANEIVENTIGDLSEFADFFKNYKLEKFEKDLESGCVFMIEEDSEILGYISMFYYPKNKYKIADWGMFEPDNDEKKKEVLEALAKLKLPRLRMFTICTVSKSTVQFLLENGFEEHCCSSFYKLVVK